jgi:hypothetical protein
MADPRKVYDYSEVKSVYLSFAADGVTITYSATTAKGSAAAGLAVRLMPGTAKTVETVGDAETVLGVLDHVEPDGTAVVQVQGVATFKGGTGATLTPGLPIVGALLSSAEGYVRIAAAATLAEVAVARGVILDSSTSTAVQVLL